MLCSSLATALRVLQLPCVLQKSHKNRKENEHVEYLVFDVAAALRPCFLVRQSCSVVHNTVRLPHETKKFVVADKCKAATRLCENNQFLCDCFCDFLKTQDSCKTRQGSYDCRKARKVFIRLVLRKLPDYRKITVRFIARLLQECSETYDYS